MKASDRVRVSVSEAQELKLYVDSSAPEKPAPGDMLTLALRVVNRGSSPVNELVLELGDSPGVKPVWSSRRLYVGDLEAGGTATVRAVLEAEEDAEAGEHELPVRLKWRGGEAEEKLELVLYRRADFEVESAGDVVRAGGKEQRVSFLIRNTGSREAEHLRLTLRASYPFTPVGSEYYIRRLAPGEESVVVFHVDVDSDAAEQRYPVELVVKWSENGEEHSGVEYSYIQVLHPASRHWYYAAAAIAALAAALLIRLRKRRAG